MNELGKVLALAQRDLMKFFRDRPRIVATFVFPIIFIGIFGVTLNAGLGQFNLGFNYVDYIFSGMLLQTVFQSSLAGIVSLVADREKDFAMSIFVSPVSRYSIVFGKILGESLVGLAQVIGIVLFGKLVVGVSFGLQTILIALPFALLAAFVGGSFGVLIASRIEKADSAQRIFPFLIFPMLFSSGAFTPVNNLPIVLNIIKNINPLYYGVDMMRNILFLGRPELAHVASNSFFYDLVVFLGLGAIFFIGGTFLFTQREGNK
jgi:ABC-2 type transport system permease protein